MFENALQSMVEIIKGINLKKFALYNYALNLK